MGSWREHQKMLNNLERRLLDNQFYDHVYREVSFKTPRGKDGEIDLFASHNNTALVFEVKSGATQKSYQKALTQVKRASRYLTTIEQYERAVLFTYTPKGLIFEGIKYKNRKI